MSTDKEKVAVSVLVKLGGQRFQELRALARDTARNTVIMPNGGSLAIQGDPFGLAWVMLPADELTAILDEFLVHRSNKAMIEAVQHLETIQQYGDNDDTREKWFLWVPLDDVLDILGVQKE